MRGIISSAVVAAAAIFSGIAITHIIIVHYASCIIPHPISAARLSLIFAGHDMDICELYALLVVFDTHIYRQ